MKFNHFLRPVIIATCLLNVPLLFAQGKRASQVVTRVDLVSMSETIPGLYLGKKKSKSVRALAFRYEKTLRYKGGRLIEISQISSNTQPEEDLTDEDKDHELKPLTRKQLPKSKIKPNDKFTKAIAKRRKKKPNLVALARVPAGARHITILLTPADNNTYVTTVINDDPTKLPYGKMRVHNFCKHPISLRFKNRKKPSIITPRKSIQISPAANKTCRYLLAYPKNKKWKIQESNIINIPPDEQVQMVILRSKSSFFVSGSGSRGGRLQVAVLRRQKAPRKHASPDPSRSDDRPTRSDGRAN